MGKMRGSGFVNGQVRPALSCPDCDTKLWCFYQISSWSDLAAPRHAITSIMALRLRTILFFGIAAGFGVVLQFLLFGAPSLRSRVSLLTSPHEPLIYHESCETDRVNHEYTGPGNGNTWVPHNDKPTIPQIEKMVSHTKGYLARDYTLSLGWNNVSRLKLVQNYLTAFKLRYIIESGILAGQILNRTLVIPSFVYARSCAFPQ